MPQSDPEGFVRREMNRLRGRLAGAIESYSFPEKQERGLITLMKQLSYDVENNIVDELKR
jgi:hypothetical protein